jgi:aspartate/tyrosine/aromatic aminotransferase
MKKSIFSNVPMADECKVFKYLKQYESCTDPEKMNLTIGVFDDGKGGIVEFECVKKAQEEIAKASFNKEYAPIGGMNEFTNSLKQIFFDPEFKPLKEERILFAHVATGGSALRIGTELITKFLTNKIYVSNETWDLYTNIFCRLQVERYPYYNREKKCLDIAALVDFLGGIDNGSVISLQLSCHNPTGLDPSNEEWDRIAEVMAKKNHLAFFDAAYLGYSTGNISDDLYPVHKFADLNVEQWIAYSSGKCFSTFSEDIGALIMIFNKKEIVNNMRSHYIIHARSLYSFAPLYGSRIINTIIEKPELRELWHKEQREIFERVKNLRAKVIEETEKKGITGLNIDNMKKQRGIFCFFDLTDEQIGHLANKYSIFVGPRGRINLTGLIEEKIPKFANALKETLEL